MLRWPGLFLNFCFFLVFDVYNHSFLSNGSTIPCIPDIMCRISPGYWSVHPFKVPHKYTLFMVILNIGNQFLDHGSHSVTLLVCRLHHTNSPPKIDLYYCSCVHVSPRFLPFLCMHLDGLFFFVNHLRINDHGLPAFLPHRHLCCYKHSLYLFKDERGH